MNFHLGKPILAMILLACVFGYISLTRKAEKPADLVVWVFADSHQGIYTKRDPAHPDEPSLVEMYAQRTGKSVQAKLMNVNALNIRLNSIFDQPAGAVAEVPDVVEIEISSVGRYFRPPTDLIGLLPLNEMLSHDELRSRLVTARLAPWMKGEVLFGLPHDLHPVSITYRDDLFRDVDIVLSQATTWPEFQRLGLLAQERWRAKGISNRRAIQLASTNADVVTQMLLQRHINLLDNHNQIHVTDPRVAQTIEFYARLVAGKNKIAGDATPGGTNWIRDLTEGDLCATFTPDWQTAYLLKFGKSLDNKFRMMPLPRFDPTDAPTSTWGGTMLAIPKQAKDKNESWKLIKHLSFSKEGLAARTLHAPILPPVTDGWDDPIWHQSEPAFGGQKIGEMYIDLARQLPERHVTPFTVIAQAQLSVVLNRTVSAIENQQDANLQSDLKTWLKDMEQDIRSRMEFGKFEE